MRVRAAQAWAEALAAWAIPEWIMAQAPESPWSFPTTTFVAAALRAKAGPLTPTHLRALEALPAEGEVLDVGAGAGAASLPLGRRARGIVAVDQSSEMLEEMRRLGGPGLSLTAVQGVWPDVASRVGSADVVICANVAYNVPQLDRFVLELTAHARSRVVLELTERHPQSSVNWLWEHFWGLTRPESPTALDARSVVAEATGQEVGMESWEGRDVLEAGPDPELVAWIRRRLCLDPSRDQELAELLASHPPDLPPRRVTLWWPGRAP